MFSTRITRSLAGPILAGALIGAATLASAGVAQGQVAGLVTNEGQYLDCASASAVCQSASAASPHDSPTAPTATSHHHKSQHALP